MADPGIVLLYMYREPANVFLFCEPFYISRVSLFFFSLLYSSVAQALMNVGSLDCKLRLLRRRWIFLGGNISSRSSCTWRFSTNSTNFHVAFVVAASFFLLVSLSFFLFLCGDFEQMFLWVENGLGVRVDWDDIRSDNHPARRYRLCLQGRGSLCHQQESWLFRCSQCSSPAKMWSTAPGPAWCPWKKPLSLRDVSKPEVPCTGQPAGLHRANARIERKVSWWVLVASDCFRNSYPSFVIHGMFCLLIL